MDCPAVWLPPGTQTLSEHHSLFVLVRYQIAQKFVFSLRQNRCQMTATLDAVLLGAIPGFRAVHPFIVVAVPRVNIYVTTVSRSISDEGFTLLNSQIRLLRNIINTCCYRRMLKKKNKVGGAAERAPWSCADGCLVWPNHVVNVSITPLRGFFSRLVPYVTAVRAPTSARKDDRNNATQYHGVSYVQHIHDTHAV